jgi:RIO kinase 1
MHDPLAPLIVDGIVDEICGRLKSGKEADLWLVRHRGELVAAKVYKAREARSFRNDAGYREGRQVRDTRTQRAMDRGSRFGRTAAEDAWKAKEADALHALHAAGVRVPCPVMFYEGVLLMELVVDAHGRPAPRLVDALVPRDQAAPLYADLRAQAIRMLTCDLIHGDLSPYNVLLGSAGPVVIDFPQVVGAAHNSQAESFFRRDVENLRRFFAALDPALHAAESDAREIWRAYVRRELTPDFVPTGRAHPAAPQPAEHRRAERHPRPGPEPRRPGARGREPDRRPEPQRRRAGPGAAPEVIRVSRPPLGSTAAPAPQHRSPSQPTAQHRSPSQPPAQHRSPSQPTAQHRSPSQPTAQHRSPSQPPAQHRPPASAPHGEGAPAGGGQRSRGRRRRRRR